MDRAGRKGGLADCNVKLLLHLMLVRECQSSVLRRTVQRRPTVILLGSITKYQTSEAYQGQMKEITASSYLRTRTGGTPCIASKHKQEGAKDHRFGRSLGN